MISQKGAWLLSSVQNGCVVLKGLNFGEWLNLVRGFLLVFTKNIRYLEGPSPSTIVPFIFS